MNRVVLKPTRVLPPERRRKKNKPHNILKGALVVIIASVLTTLAIHASDSFRNPGSVLSAGVGWSGVREHCPSDMAYITNAGGGYCIDRYEESADAKCQRPKPANQFDTEINITDVACLPLSVKGNTPWVNVALHEALAICAKAGKRLPSNKEWYRAALGTPDRVDGSDTSCALGHIGQTQADMTGAHTSCISSYGVFDMVGNVWEWVDGEVDNGVYGNHELPSEGYVSEVDVDGVPTKIATSSDPAFGEDYLFIDKSGLHGMIRGGFWSLKEKAGIYDVNATIPPTFIGNAVGFRCAKDAQ